MKIGSLGLFPISYEFRYRGAPLMTAIPPPGRAGGFGREGERRTHVYPRSAILSPRAIEIVHTGMAKVQPEGLRLSRQCGSLFLEL